MELQSIWAEYEMSITTFIRSRVANPADADDIAQDVLVKTFTGLKDVRSEDRIKAWLFQVTKRAIIDHYRKRQLPQSEKSPEEALSTEEDDAVHSELSHCILPFMQALPEESRAILMAIDIEGRSQKEYAQALGIPYSTLKSRVQASRAQLRGIFEECCRFSLDRHGNLADFDPKTQGRRCGGPSEAPC